MIINYTSIKTKKLIKQAIELYESSKFLDNIIGHWQDHGWIHDESGISKTVFIKGNVVIKYGIEEDIAKESIRWSVLKTTKHRNNIARVYGIYDDAILIQQRVYNIKPLSCACIEAAKKASKLKLVDWQYNHGHDKKGRPIFFDC